MFRSGAGAITTTHEFTFQDIHKDALFAAGKPKYFIPVHGDPPARRWAMWMRLRRDSRQSHRNSLKQGVRARNPVTAGRRAWIPRSLEEIEEVVIRDRKHLSEDDDIIASPSITHRAKWNGFQEIVTRGLMSDNGQELITGHDGPTPCRAVQRGN